MGIRPYIHGGVIMDGFVMSGKAFAVCEDLRILAERNKGITVAELLKKQRLERIEKALEQQLHGGK